MPAQAPTITNTVADKLIKLGKQIRAHRQACVSEEAQSLVQDHQSLRILQKILSMLGILRKQSISELNKINHTIIKIFNVPFIKADNAKICDLLEQNIFLVVPSGPGLAEIDRDKKYYHAIQAADAALPDSGLMVLILRMVSRIKLQKLSGPKFLNEFLSQDTLRQKNILFLIEPSEGSSNTNREYLNNRRVPLSKSYQYVAPMYNRGAIADETLIQILESLPIKPRYILVNLGGGVQEQLGLFLKNHLSFSVSIICTGAAIAFFTGEQVRLPVWVDRFYLGWLYRIFNDPSRFLIRYIKAFRLVWIFIKYRRFIFSEQPISS